MTPFDHSPDPRTDPEGWLDYKLPHDWNWLNPNYDQILRLRAEKLSFLRSTPGALAAVLQHYALDYGFYDFIFDWGRILDPRDSAFGREPDIPFILFPRQVEMLTWMQEMVEKPAKGLSGKGNISKTRGCGASTIACFFALWYWRFRANSRFGMGSNLERNVYDKGNPKSLFWKIEHGVESWPREFLPRDFVLQKHLSKGAGAGKLINPENGATITGDAGPDIGRGDRTLVYFIDEHRSLQHPASAEAGLNKTTNTLIRISTQRKDSLFLTQCLGLEKDNPSNLFTYHWQEDPRMTQEVFERERAEAESLGMLDIFRLEVEGDAEGIVVNTLIPRRLMDEAAKRHPTPFGPAVMVIDVAAQGNDNAVISYRRGLWHSGLRKFPYADDSGRALAAEVIQLAEEILTQGIPLAAIIYELEGPGYALNTVLSAGPLASVLRPIHPGQKLKDGRHYNLRAQAWELWRRAMVNGAAIPNDRALIILGSSIRKEETEDAKGRKILKLEPKRLFRKRLAADPDNPMGGPSPDEADNVALSYVPVEYANFTLEDYRRALGQGSDYNEVDTSNMWGWSYG